MELMTVWEKFISDILNNYLYNEKENRRVNRIEIEKILNSEVTND